MRSIAIILTAIGAMGLLLPGSYAQQDSICEYQWDKWENCNAQVCVEGSSVQGKPVTVAGNVTRIAKNGLSLCLDALQLSGAADVIFIIDLSGSMNPNWMSESGKIYSWITMLNEPGKRDPVSTGDSTISFAGSTLSLPIVADADVASAYHKGVAGDPYGQRGIALQQGIDSLAAAVDAAKSTAGYIGFGLGVEYDHRLPPVFMDATGKAKLDAQVQKLKDAVANRYDGGGTNYHAPLDTAIAWLKNPSLSPNEKKAIVFVSDGRALQGKADSAQIQALNDLNVDFFGIFLETAVENKADLQSLARATGGYLKSVPPAQPQAFGAAIADIVKRISVGFTADSIVAINKTNGAGAQSVSVAANSAGNAYDVTMDGIIPLNAGTNQIEVSALFSAQAGDVKKDTVITFTATIDVSGAPVQCSTFTCFPVSRLEILNSSGGAASELSRDYSQYMIRLTVWDPSLSQTYVNVSTGIDKEDSLVLKRISTSQSYAVLEGIFSFKSSINIQAAHNNGTTEAELQDLLNVRWRHPIDPRDTAAASMPVIHNPGPAITEALYYSGYTPGETTSNPDTLVITFSEAVRWPKGGFTEPSAVFSIKTSQGATVSLADIDFVIRDSKSIMLIVADGVDITPEKDSISIIDLAGTYITDVDGNPAPSDPGVLIRWGSDVPWIARSVPNPVTVGTGANATRIPLEIQGYLQSAAIEPGVDGSKAARIKSTTHGIAIQVSAIKDLQSTNVSIYDAVGNAVLKDYPMLKVQDGQIAGVNYFFAWDGRNRNGRFVGRGTYLAVVEIMAAGGIKARKLLKLGIMR
jgi:hypothetical protein